MKKLFLLISLFSFNQLSQAQGISNRMQELMRADFEKSVKQALLEVQLETISFTYGANAGKDPQKLCYRIGALNGTFMGMGATLVMLARPSLDPRVMQRDAEKLIKSSISLMGFCKLTHSTLPTIPADNLATLNAKFTEVSDNWNAVKSNFPY